MVKLPKLKVKVFGYAGEDICDIEQAMYRFNYNEGVTYIVEGQAVMSHDELVKLAEKADNKKKNFLMSWSLVI